MTEGAASEGGAALIWSPFASAEQAETAARQLLAEQLVACANILPHVTAIFRYEGTVQSAAEVGVLFKTAPHLLNRATERLAELHPYAVPAIAGWHAASVPQATQAWLLEAVEKGGQE